MAKVLISMREEFLDRIDEVAGVEQRSRSELIRQAIRVYVIRMRREAYKLNPLLMQSLLMSEDPQPNPS